MEWDAQRIGNGCIILGGGIIFIFYLGLFIKLMVYLTEKRSASLIIIPVLGPFFCNLGQLFLGVDWYWYFLPWIIDFGTILFFFATPRIFKDWWQTSRFTRLATYVDRRDNVEVKLSLHQNQIYLLQKKFHRQKGEFGMSEFSEVGHYEESPTTIILSALYQPFSRVFSNTAAGFVVESESGFPEDSMYIKKADYSLAGFTLAKKS
jgi:hypothetical protein